MNSNAIGTNHGIGAGKANVYAPQTTAQKNTKANANDTSDLFDILSAANDATASVISDADTSLIDTYEPSAAAETKAAATYTPDVASIDKMLADVEARTAQLRSLVEKLITKQGGTAYSVEKYWEAFRDGAVEATPEEIEQAQADIAEDGYWGVEQTSDRILKFAQALSGGDASKADELLEAFKAGYAEAEKAWGGTLPDICKQTYEAVEQKFADWKASAAEGTA